ncbi:MAG TPA: hypothetical protein DEE98_06315 [Elusimicrobia bacterium]|nr:MAG: hypothetical protein A2278_02220 [Elusimicrobia bacterium RIFOXYA12_FULL_49_49]OGS10165.1 MAG: hypothetical protein A2204_00485 [Elusimicrobia bacterium RIFOXYA1_FULL_47_7]OGS11577.1 MAG: hypothetical protein A2386_03905 [Elusimicrobia bacterium RIFOXYB1_FULL_48_9]OGS16863.1 MAG: hypothetical protein A2251_05670 [Elusimicrobia bacterium RIFOXYA2_FULL_47_53]OGS32091.1 MAG: hypothetical protein A2323_08445 [Elusimicrobia bacterium RIFOXYB2_FULL_46_23]HBU69984.1 hypothetical protein [Elus
MKKHDKRKTLIFLSITALAASLLYWILDSLFDTVILKEGNFVQTIFTGDVDILWMRILAIVFISGYSAALYIIFKKNIIAESTLARELSKNNNLFEVSGSFIITIGRDGKISSINKKGVEILGFSDPNEVIGKDWAALFIPEKSRAGIISAIDTLFNGDLGKYEYHENSILRRDGSEKEFLWHNSLLKDNNGDTYAILSSGEDLSEFKKAESRLRYSEERFRQLSELSGEWIWEVDAAGKYTYSNDTVFDILGYSREEVIGKYFYDFFTEGDRKNLAPELFKGFENKVVFKNIVCRNIHKSGRVQIHESNAMPMLSESGELIGYRGMQKDITQRFEYQEKVIRNYETESAINNLLSKSLENISIDKLLEEALSIIISVSWLSLESKGCIFLANESGETLIMKTQTGLSDSLLTSCSSLPFGKCLCGIAAKEKKVVFSSALDARHSVNYPGIHDHGHYCVPIISGEKMLGVINLYLAHGYKYNENDIAFLTAIANTLAGVIERKKTEEALKQRLEFEQKVSEISAKFINIRSGEINTELAASLGKISRFFSIEHSFLYLFNTSITKAELFASTPPHNDAGLSFSKLLEVKDIQWLMNFFKRDEYVSMNLTENNLISQDDLKFLAESGEQTIKFITMLPMYFKDTLRGFYGFASFYPKNPFDHRDFSLLSLLGEVFINSIEHTKLEMQLFQSQKIETVGRLAGSVAHDLNNLMTPIIGYSQLLLNTLNEADPAHEDAKEIFLTAERASVFTKQLLAFSRRQTLNPSVININTLILNIQKMLNKLIGAGNRLDLNLDTGLKNVNVDPSQIDQVLTNLVINAKDAMQNGGTIELATSNVKITAPIFDLMGDIPPGNYVLLSVTDHGSGMSEEVKNHLFEPFFTTKEKGKGTGLGLATCFGIIKQSGGNIIISSELNKGTTIKIYLPAAEAAEDTTQVADNIVDYTKGNETILLAEDDVTVMNLTSRVLKEQGYRVIEAMDGETAMRLYQENMNKGLKLFLSDAVMPKINGTDLARTIRRNDKSTKIIVFSGFPNIAEEVAKIENSHFIQKPFSPFDLLKKVREVLN